MQVFFFLLFSSWDHRDGVGTCRQLIAVPYMSISSYLFGTLKVS